uniref:Heat shock 70 kDa protein 12A n=1 Tax=Pygocentrus nattereri TaxID=42514 RepID=A0AAR2LHP6_PYGNA
MDQHKQRIANLRLENEKCNKKLEDLRQENRNLKSENSKLRSQLQDIQNELPSREVRSPPQDRQNELPSPKERSPPQDSQNELPSPKESMSKAVDHKLESSDESRESEPPTVLKKRVTKKHWVKLPFQLSSTENDGQQPQETNADDPKSCWMQSEDVTKKPLKQCTSPAKAFSPRTQPKVSLVSIGIDFGTAFTGYSFGFKGAKQIRQPKWGEEYGMNTPKTPTCILFDENKNFLKFGYDAIMYYTRQTRRNEAKKLFLFDDFKMELYGKVLHRDSMMTAKNGKKMRAMKVFSESLKFMKDHALDMMGKHTAGVTYSASDATWVLTVPAIWSSAAKQFMTEAATEAGLVTESEPERLIVALEPEAASVWCKQLPKEGFMEGDLTEAETIEQVPGTQYMVVDCGGGTIDITVHEVVEGGRLKELHRVSGNNMGGQTVDKNFKAFIREIFSENVFDEFEENHPSELQRLLYDFSICKRYDGEVLVQCPYSLQQIASKVDDIEAYFSRDNDVDWESGQILLSGAKLKDLHEDSVRGIESLMKEILKKPTLNIRYIFLVGGFALSPYVNRFVKEKFGSKCQVLCPVDAQMAVVNGAVMFGMMPNVVESRISVFTYGIAVVHFFDKIKHKGKSKYVSKDGVHYCDVCFHCLVKKDESVPFDEAEQYIFNALEIEQNEMLFSFYCTEKETAEFVDEEGMMKIGSLAVSMPKISQGRNHSVILEIKFGFTEMQATATDVDSGETTSVKMDFMSK